MQRSKSSSRLPSIVRRNSLSTSMALSVPKRRNHLRTTSASRKVRSSNPARRLGERICHHPPRRISKDRNSKVPSSLCRLRISSNPNQLLSRRQARDEPLLK